MAVISGGQIIEESRPRLLVNAGAPTNGTSGTGAGEAAPGSLLVDTTNKRYYVNTNTKASPTLVRAPGRLVTAKTANYTVTDDESGDVLTTTGATGTVTFTMPPAVVGLEYYFRVGAAFELRIDPDGTETIALPSTGVAGAAGKYLSADASGETVHVICTVAGSWAVFGFTGTWTAEA